jgi:hypothetical protein
MTGRQHQAAVTPVLVGAVLCRVAHGSAGAGDDDPLFMLSWNDFFFASILTRSNAITAPIAVNFMNYAGRKWGWTAAGGTMVMLPVLVFSLLVRRFLISKLARQGARRRAPSPLP